MPERCWYATKDDLLGFIPKIESTLPIKYVQLGVYLSPDVSIHNRVEDIPDLGRAFQGEKVADRYFMVVRRDALYVPHAVPQRKGGIWYFAEATNNESIIFQPGGLIGERMLIEGGILTNNKTVGAKRLFDLFDRTMKKHFERIDRFYVGQEAMSLLKARYRLTDCTNAPGKPRLRLNTRERRKG